MMEDGEISIGTKIHSSISLVFFFTTNLFSENKQKKNSSHYYHHSKGRGRFVYFNLGYVTPFWDQICGTRWHENHPNWVIW